MLCAGLLNRNFKHQSFEILYKFFNNWAWMYPEIGLVSSSIKCLINIHNFKSVKNIGKFPFYTWEKFYRIMLLCKCTGAYFILSQEIFHNKKRKKTVLLYPIHINVFFFKYYLSIKNLKIFCELVKLSWGKM